MVVEALAKGNFGEYGVTVPSAGYTSGEVLCLPDGRAAVVAGLKNLTSGEKACLKTVGPQRLAKGTSLVVLKGDKIYWDRSANTCTPLRALAGADFYVGAAMEDNIAGTGTTLLVDLNVKPNYLIDIKRDIFDTILVLTAGTPALTLVPGGVKLAFSATAEAQKVDAMSQLSVPIGLTGGFIVGGRFAVYDIGDDAAVDFNVGLANGTHASDGDIITERMFLHLDGTSLNIMAESDDGTTEVTTADTTVDAVDNTFFDFRFDCRDLTDIQLYINGVNRLAASVFKLDAATGPLKLLAHLEKTSNDTPGDFRIEELYLQGFDVDYEEG